MSDESLSTLLNMGFGFEESTAALNKCKRDVSEAVAYLTDPARSVVPMETETAGLIEVEEEEDFPSTVLKDIKARIYSENWSMSSRDGEGILKCIKCSLTLANAKSIDSNEDCKMFLFQILPVAFTKLLTNTPVYDSELQDAIYNILSTYLPLAVCLLNDKLEVSVLKILSTIMDPRSEFNFRNRSKRPKHSSNHEMSVVYAQSPSRTTFRDPYGWLITLINTFGAQGGFNTLVSKVCVDEVEQSPGTFTLAHVMRPWGCCIEYLVADLVGPIFKNMMERSILVIRNMNKEDFKSKEIGLVCDLIVSMKYICTGCGSFFTSQDAKGMDKMRLQQIEMMLKNSHFNSRMNALNETLRIVEETKDMNVKHPIDSQQVLDWLNDHKILMRALENNLHQAQYTAKLKKIADFIGHNISAEDLNHFWKLQEGRQPVVVENAHNILAAAAVHFNEKQASHLFSLITQSWIKENNKGRHRLLTLLGKLGKLPLVLDHIWALIHLKDVGIDEIEQGLSLHLELLNSTLYQDDAKKKYVMKCVGDIENNEWVVPAMKYLVQLLQTCLQSSSKLGKNMLKELQNNVVAVKLVTNSLVSTYKHVTDGSEARIHHDTRCRTSNYTLSVCLNTHLKMLKLVLEHCSDWLQWSYVESIWDCLASHKAAPTHFDQCCDWFASAINDLDATTQTKFFEHRLMLLQASTIRAPAFNCFKEYFVAINTRDGKIQRMFSGMFTVMSLKLTGLNFIWNVCLEARDERVSQDAMEYLLKVSFSLLSPKLKKDCSALHLNFTQHCRTLLKQCEENLQKSGVPSAECMKRTTHIIKITTDYILLAEEFDRGVRLLEPHGATYLGPLVSFFLEIDKENHAVFLHENEKVSALRLKAAKITKTVPDSVELQIADKTLPQSKDKQLIHLTPIRDGTVVKVKVLPAVSSPVKSWSDEINTPVKFEKQLPGVILTTDPSVHTTLQLLSTMGGGVSGAIQKLLNRLPTDPRIIEILESLQSNRMNNVEPILKDLLSGPVMKLIYNLEALSACIMPVDKDSSDRQALDNLFYNLSSEIKSNASAVSLCGLDYLYNIFKEENNTNNCSKDSKNGVSPRKSASCRNMTLSELFLDEPCQEEYLEVSQLVVAIFRGLFCGISSPQFKHAAPLNVTYLKKLNKSQLLDMMKFFAHTSLCACFGSPLKSWGQLLPNQTSTSVDKISPAHSALGCEAFEMLMLCAVHHPEGINVLSEVMEMPGYKRLLLDLLLYTPSSQVRSLVAQELEKLCQIQSEISTVDTNKMDVDLPNGHRNPNVHHKLFKILLKTPLPIWGPTTHFRESQLRLLSRCSQFFNLCGFLLKDLTLDCAVCRQLRITELVKDEIKFLKTMINEGKNHQELITGHLRTLCSLSSINGVDKRHVGKKLIPTLLGDFIFPAANLMFKSSCKTRSKGFNETPLPLINEDTQSAAYSLLLALVTDCPENSRDVALELTRLHHHPTQDLATDWNYYPMVQPRAECGFVGLKNGGATCYMNAVLQQLHAIPGLSESILCLQPPSPSSPNRNSQPIYGEEMFLQYQHLLGNLSESRLKFYTPEGFWKAFKLWGQPINIHEQQDAFELFNNLTDQVDDVLKSRGEPRIYQNQFGGQFVDQKICVECPHRSELIEPFMSLSVSTRTGNLDDSLEQFVKGELLEGDNAYLCEECDEKRTTLKRLCIKTLPNTLVIHLKRFDYDWERNKAFKFDDYFSFPNQLDMLPYTQIGVEGTPKQKRDVLSLYTLRGVIVHSGQANAGHYYSFIKSKTNNWFKFNDDTVTPIDLTDQTLVEECFGGEFKSKGSTRNRYWNAYILIYDRINEMSPPSPWKKPQKPISPTKRLKPSRLSLTKLSDIPDNMETHDPVNALEELIKTGEKSGLFHERLPPIVRNSIIETNTKLLKERAIFNAAYVEFVRKLVITNIASPNIKDYCEWSTKLLCNFYLHTFLHVNETYQFHEEAWLETFKILMESDISAVTTFLDFVSSNRNQDYLVLHLLTCPRATIRNKFATLVKIALDSLIKFEGLSSAGSVFIARYLGLISKELTENHKYSDHYFGILYHYSKISYEAACQLRSSNFVSLFVKFLIGSGNNGEQQHKWLSGQLTNFVAGYQTLAQILSCTSLKQFHTSFSNSPNSLLHVETSLDTEVSCDGIKTIMTDAATEINVISHLLMVCHTVPTAHTAISNILCMLTWCIESMTAGLINQISSKLASVQAHELKPLFTLLLHLFALEDPYQLMRVEYMIGGDSGLLGLVKSSSSTDPKRAYQCVKFLTQLMRSNPTAKEHILSHMTEWQWSVNWLRNAFETEVHSSTLSNESSATKGFQRTTSAQETLSDATALLNEFESSQ